jgi:hypothetical protein
LPRDALEAQGVRFSRVDPRRARDFAAAMGVIGKTDRLDARLLAELGARQPRTHRRAAGLRSDPRREDARDSGKRVGRRAIDGGRPVVRTMRYIVGLHACRRDAASRTFRMRLEVAGKSFTAAIPATASKPSTVRNAMLAAGTDYRPIISSHAWTRISRQGRATEARPQPRAAVETMATQRVVQAPPVGRSGVATTSTHAARATLNRFNE